MIKKDSIALLLPAYNEANFIGLTIKAVPSYVDHIIVINDGSTDNTAQVVKKIQSKNPKVTLLNKPNGGVGSALKTGLKHLATIKPTYTVIAAGDNQCDLTVIQKFVNLCQTHGFDVCRGNRFLDNDNLQNMPALRRIGNAVYSFITKIVSGYYSLFDFQSSYSAIKTSVLLKINPAKLRDDYLWDNSLWINLNIVGAVIKEIPIPSKYAGEVSNINYFTFISHSLSYLFSAFLDRIYQKYILILHPIGVFFVGGLFLFLFGLVFGVWVAYNVIGPPTASTATVMLSVVPVITGFQLLLQAIVLDIQNEPKLSSR